MSPLCLATSGKRNRNGRGYMGAVVDALSLEYVSSVFRFNLV
jgi:hypothetical protein